MRYASLIVCMKHDFTVIQWTDASKGLEHFSQISSAITSLSRLCLIWVEVVVPWNDAIYEDRWDTWDPLGAKNPPKHGMKEGSNARLFVDRFSIVFSVLNLLGNIGNVATALAHPHWTCSRVSAYSLSSIALCLRVWLISFEYSSSRGVQQLPYVVEYAWPWTARIPKKSKNIKAPSSL
jgi:hypothetical protein